MFSLVGPTKTVEGLDGEVAMSIRCKNSLRLRKWVWGPKGSHTHLLQKEIIDIVKQ